MEKVSAKQFFTVLWRGLCQAVAWFFGYFGYRRDSKFARGLWCMFAMSSAFIVTVIACFLIYAFCYELKDEYQKRSYHSYWAAEEMSDDISYLSECEGGFLFKTDTRKPVMKDVYWAARPAGENDTLGCYSNGKLKGYFNLYTGKTMIKPQYRHAWVFSDGIACVEVDGRLKFIDGQNQLAFDKTFDYSPKFDYVFHNGYCLFFDQNSKAVGLIDREGETVVAPEYDDIVYCKEPKYWVLMKDNERAVLDMKLDTILPMMECKLYVNQKSIDVINPDNTVTKYDLQGNLIDGFYIYSFEYMEYETEELYEIKKSNSNWGEEETELKHKMRRARLCKYTAGNEMEGLITADGQIVTKPIYNYIKAIGPDTYLCTFDSDTKKVVDGKGK